MTQHQQQIETMWLVGFMRLKGRSCQCSPTSGGSWSLIGQSWLLGNWQKKNGEKNGDKFVIAVKGLDVWECMLSWENISICNFSVIQPLK